MCFTVLFHFTLLLLCCVLSVCVSVATEVVLFWWVSGFFAMLFHFLCVMSVLRTLCLCNLHGYVLCVCVISMGREFLFLVSFWWYRICCFLLSYCILLWLCCVFNIHVSPCVQSYWYFGEFLMVQNSLRFCCVVYFPCVMSVLHTLCLCDLCRNRVIIWWVSGGKNLCFFLVFACFLYLCGICGHRVFIYHYRSIHPHNKHEIVQGSCNMAHCSRIAPLYSSIKT